MIGILLKHLFISRLFCTSAVHFQHTTYINKTKEKCVKSLPLEEEVTSDDTLSSDDGGLNLLGGGGISFLSVGRSVSSAGSMKYNENNIILER